MKRAITVLLVGLCVIACANTYKLSRLELSMTKEDVRRVMGEPKAVRASMVNEWGQTIEVWEYGLYESGDDAFYGFDRTYFLYFCDGELYKWGKPGDLRAPPDETYEIRHR